MKKLISTARTTEVADTIKRILASYEKENSLQEDDFLKTFFREAHLHLEQITEAIKREVSVSKLNGADVKRDEAIRSLSNLLLGYSTIPIEEMKKHGEKLYSVFSKYGLKIIRENYASQSALIESLLKDLSSPELKESIETLSGVKECIDLLKEEQNKFTALRLEHDASSSKKIGRVSASVIRKSLLDSINKKLVPYLIAMKIANTDQYKNFVNVVAQVIENTNIGIKRRTTSKSEIIPKIE